MALAGFLTIGVLIAVGYAMAHLGVLTDNDRRMMSKLALVVSSPVLMMMILSRADLDHVFARSVIASAAAILTAGGLYLIISAFAFRHSLEGRTIGTLLACYTNAGNLGLPVATYALGDGTWMAPILLIQMIILQPTALAILDAARARRSGTPVPVRALITLPVRNPLTVGCLAGLAINLSGWTIPAVVASPLDMLAAVAVPTMLLAFGVSLRLDPRPQKGRESAESWVLVVLKIIVQPLTAYVVARFVLGLDESVARAVTVVAALPPAQNIFIFASRYEVRMLFARDTIFRATAASVPVILLAATLL